LRLCWSSCPFGQSDWRKRDAPEQDEGGIAKKSIKNIATYFKILIFAADFGSTSGDNRECCSELTLSN